MTDDDVMTPAERLDRHRSERKYDVLPSLRMEVMANDEKGKLHLSWGIGPSDASCWREPCTLSISGTKDEWETYAYLTREHMRIIRDFLTSMLACPDLRE